jgi:hypothetical protein
MTLGMEELDIAFLDGTGEPLWQPLGENTVIVREERAADEAWTELVLQLELDGGWDEIAGLLTSE